jgi:hypothetical protein
VGAKGEPMGVELKQMFSFCGLCNNTATVETVSIEW